ncbi:unnamed protein product [Paramecium pentaurelia]|uniref:Uncharacterized protein n=1 Tax=Paramecium pentaurelia TaxID=43138 RepID=A0A8S1W7S3_9CILI|nr:unnamed protein product [Paramecium pentaurelia]
MDIRLKRFDVFGLSRNQQSQKRLDSTRRLDDRSFLQLKQYKHEFIRTPSNSNTCQTQMKKLRLKHKPQINQNQILSYSLSIQNIEQLPNRSLDPKVIKLIIPNHKKNTQSQKEGITTTRNYYNNYFAHHEQNENRASFPSIKFKNKIVKSQFEANLQFYKKQQSIPIQVKLVNQDDIKREFQSIRNRYAKSRTELENYADQSKPFLRTSKSKFHLSQKRNQNQKQHNKNNNNSVESQTNLDLDYLEDFQKYDKNNLNQLRDEVIQNS